MQYRSPVGFGPSSKTWPRWPSQRRQVTAVRVIQNDRSSFVLTALSKGAQKLGQPVPLSNLVADEKRSREQPAQAKVPRRSSCRSGLVKGGSVPSLRRMAYWAAVSVARHSASLWTT